MDLPTIDYKYGSCVAITVPAGGLSLPSVTLPPGKYMVSESVGREVQAYLRQCEADQKRREAKGG